MNNFLMFIEKDIAAKKTLIQTLPVKTKTNIRKYNEAILDIESKYEEYRTGVRNYLLAKSRSFQLDDEKIENNNVNESIIALENVRFLLNPTNTYFEKMGFDVLLYQLSRYYVFNFKSLNEIINSFLDKFDLVGIHLTKNDFNYTCYVYEYMESFLSVRYSNEKNYDKVSEIFEKIYWINPDILTHVELNFRKLIRLNSKKFEAYTANLQKDVMLQNNISSYEECIEKLKLLYGELKIYSKESVNDVINASKNNEFNIEHYLENNKVRINAFQSIIPSNININNCNEMLNVCYNLEKLKNNIAEYENYLNFLPLFNSFRDEYKSLIGVDYKNYKELNRIEELIITKEKELEKLNKKIFTNKVAFLEIKNENLIKSLKMESISKAKELYELYDNYDKEYFKTKVLRVLNNTITVSDVLNLYYSFDYFKKMSIQKVYEITDYDQIIKYSCDFDLYAMDLSNIIINGIPIFGESDVPKVIANKYRLNNIKVTENDLQPDNLKALLNKINLILRVNMIENSNSSVEKIWFITNVEKIISSESIIVNE